MSTLDKLNEIANNLFEVNYVKLSKPQEIEVFAHFLAKYAVFVQPKSRSFAKYSEIVGK